MQDMQQPQWLSQNQGWVQCQLNRLQGYFIGRLKLPITVLQSDNFRRAQYGHQLCFEIGKLAMVVSNQLVQFVETQMPIPCSSLKLLRMSILLTFSTVGVLGIWKGLGLLLLRFLGLVGCQPVHLVHPRA